MVSRGGKKQRDFVKSFEDYQVTYDGSCRDTNNGNIAQYVYGGDGFAANELEKIKTKLGESTTFIVLERVTDAINTKYGF
jgi:DNA-directed RNA polymerase beta' subunit